jgi:hypothetical protein
VGYLLGLRDGDLLLGIVLALPLGVTLAAIKQAFR